MIQADGLGSWSVIGTDDEIVIPENGFLFVFLSNRSLVIPVYFDDLRVGIVRGRLREENHYSPHGLPVAHMGTEAPGSIENRQKHQGNEYIKDLGLNWMDFRARQYDPQIGRFLGVDPLGDYYGQDRYSPYAAMGNQPESMVDPNGLYFGPPAQFTKMYGAGGEPSGSSGNLSISLDKLSNSLSRLVDLYGGGGGLWTRTATIDNMTKEEFAEYTRSINSSVINTYGSASEAAVNQPTQEGMPDSNMPDPQKGKGEPPCRNCSIGPFSNSDVGTGPSNGFVVDFIGYLINGQEAWNKFASDVQPGNDKIIILAHSNGYHVEDSRTGSPVNMRGAYGLDNELKNEFFRYKEIIQKRIPTTIYLIGCNTDEIARSLSKMHSFLTVVGSTGFVHAELVNDNTGARIGGVSSSDQINLNDRSWNFYRHGQVINTQPGGYFYDTDNFR